MAAELPIPIYTNLNHLYANLGTTLNHAERWNTLVEEFEKRYGRKPEYIARAPGRINVIGEHIDYALFGVLPTAVERDILIACAPRSPAKDKEEAYGEVVANNTHPKYTESQFVPEKKAHSSMFKGISDSEPGEDVVHVEQWHLDIDTSQLRWESYIKAGYYGVLNNFFAPADTDAKPVPMDMLVSGNLPSGSGLSSSAAMVVGSTLAFLAANGKLEDANLTKGRLVEIAVENEKRVGVNSGGMDQAASVISQPGSVLYITFYPKLSATPTSLPPRAVLVVANSLVVADKAVSAKWCYNLRVVETLVGARILARHLGVKLDDKEKVTYREVVGRLAEEKKGEEAGKGGGMEESRLKEAIQLVLNEVDHLKGRDEKDGEGVSMEEMIELSGLTADAFNELYLSWVEVEADNFKLYRRAKHVLSEALRVLEFSDICQKGESETVLQELGTLMNESHKSCNDEFDCSCPELNELTELARQSGAYGSRLTGAGWGGCCVSLVAEDEVESFLQKMKAGYGRFKDLEGEALSEALFATRPSSGACVFKYTE